MSQIEYMHVKKSVEEKKKGTRENVNEERKNISFCNNDDEIKTDILDS